MHKYIAFVVMRFYILRLQKLNLSSKDFYNYSSILHYSMQSQDKNIPHIFERPGPKQGLCMVTSTYFKF